MNDHCIPKVLKDGSIAFRASTEFHNALEDYTKRKKINKSDFIRTAVANEMYQDEADAISAMLSENALYNFVLRESVTSRTCKQLIKNYKGEPNDEM